MKILAYILAVLAIALCVLYFTGRKAAHSEIMIDAPVEKVWQVIRDTQSYPEWNSVMQLKRGNVAEGSELVYTFTQDEETQYDVKIKVKQIIDNKLLNQVGGIPAILTYDHRYALEPSDGNKTKLTIHEDYRGAYVNFWNPELVEKAYQRLNENIKTRSESLN